MNDLMTKSLMDYMELKKESMKESYETESDLEKGQEAEDAKEDQDNKFLGKVKLIETEIDELSQLLHNLKALITKVILNSSTGSSVKMINSNTITILRKAKRIKATLEWLHKSNPDQVMSVTNGLRIQLRGIVKDLQVVREQALEKVGREAEDVVKEEEGMKEVEDLLVEMAVLVELNGKEEEEIRSIEGEEELEENVVGLGTRSGVGLYLAEWMKEQRKNCKCWVGLFLLLVLVGLLAILAQ